MNSWQKHMSDKSVEELQDVIQNHSDEYNPEVIRHIQELLINSGEQITVQGASSVTISEIDPKERVKYNRKWAVISIATIIVITLIFILKHNSYDYFANGARMDGPTTTAGNFGAFIGSIIGCALGAVIVYFLVSRKFKKLPDRIKAVSYSFITSLLIIITLNYLLNSFNVFYYIFLTIYAIFDLGKSKSFNPKSAIKNAFPPITENEKES